MTHEKKNNRYSSNSRPESALRDCRLRGGGKGKKGPSGLEKIKAFIVHSYEEDHVCGAPQGKGITEALRNEFKDRIQIKSHFMNTKTINSAPEKMEQEGLLVLREVESFKPDIVFTLDDDAFREVGLKLKGKNYPIVFSGLNGQPEKYNQTAPFLDRRADPMRISPASMRSFISRSRSMS